MVTLFERGVSSLHLAELSDPKENFSLHAVLKFTSPQHDVQHCVDGTLRIVLKAGEQ